MRTICRFPRAGRGASIALIPALVFCALFSTTGARAATFSAQILPNYQSGEFGSDVQTDVVFVPLVLGLDTDRNALRLTIPWLNVSSDEPVLFSNGEVIGRPGTTGVNERTTESGLGDVVLKEEYFFVNGGGGRTPWLSGIVRLKFPTADDAKGLGTGEMDYGAGVGLTQPVSDRWSILGEAGYIWRGDPEGVDLQNTPWLFAGVQFKPNATASFYVAYDSQASIFAERDDIRALVAGLDYRVSDTVTFKPNVSIGLSDTAEDFGFTVGMSIRRPL